MNIFRRIALVFMKNKKPKITYYDRRRDKLFLKFKTYIFDNWYVFLSISFTLTFIWLLNDYFPAIQNNDLANWTTLSLEGGIFIPLAYSFAKYFFKIEKNENDKLKKKLDDELFDYVGKLLTGIENIQETLIDGKKRLNNLQHKNSEKHSQDFYDFLRRIKDHLEREHNTLWNIYESKRSILHNEVNMGFVELNDLYLFVNERLEFSISNNNSSNIDGIFQYYAEMLLEELPHLIRNHTIFDESSRNRKNSERANKMLDIRIKKFPTDEEIEEDDEIQNQVS